MHWWTLAGGMREGAYGRGGVDYVRVFSPACLQKVVDSLDGSWGQLGCNRSVVLGGEHVQSYDVTESKHRVNRSVAALASGPSACLVVLNPQRPRSATVESVLVHRVLVPCLGGRVELKFGFGRSSVSSVSSPAWIRQSCASSDVRGQNCGRVVIRDGAAVNWVAQLEDRAGWRATAPAWLQW